MLLTEEKGSLKIVSDHYALTFVNDRPFVNLDDGRGNRLAELFVLSGVNPLDGRDDSTWAGAWEVDESPHEITLSLTAYSSVWTRKTYRFRCRPERFVYEMEVEGRGRLAEVNYFGGCQSAQVRWGTGFFWSGQRFKQGFTPEPNSDEVNYFSPAEGASIGLTGVPLPGRADWFFTPPPFCFCFSGGKRWLGMGVEAKPGHNLYTEYNYHARRDCFYLSLSFDGRTQVDGVYRLPSIGFDFAEGEYQALSAHVSSLQANAYVRRADIRPKPAWWREPIFSGWGEQSYLAELEQGKASDYARQELYEAFMQTLERNQVNPGMVVIDDKWQASYGENTADPNKWPDLAGFIRKQHAHGRRVLLWFKAWDPEGLPANECITNTAGLPVAVDPTNPAFEQRLRQSVRRMLSVEGYDADGFKIDFTARLPSSPGLSIYGETWGLELMKLYLGIVYEEAKQAKPDALIMTHTPHPYLAEVTDMIRLNDINTGKDVSKAMRLRARVASITCPSAIIDTDNWPIPNRAAWRKYLSLQPELGVPSLYYASHIDQSMESLTAHDYQLIRQAWSRYRQQAFATTKTTTEEDSSSRLPTFSAWQLVWRKKSIG